MEDVIFTLASCTLTSSPKYPHDIRTPLIPEHLSATMCENTSTPSMVGRGSSTQGPASERLEKIMETPPNDIKVGHIDAKNTGHRFAFYFFCFPVFQHPFTPL